MLLAVGVGGHVRERVVAHAVDALLAGELVVLRQEEAEQLVLEAFEQNERGEERRDKRDRNALDKIGDDETCAAVNALPRFLVVARPLNGNCNAINLNTCTSTLESS